MPVSTRYEALHVVKILRVSKMMFKNVQKQKSRKKPSWAWSGCARSRGVTSYISRSTEPIRRKLGALVENIPFESRAAVYQIWRSGWASKSQSGNTKIQIAGVGKTHAHRVNISWYRYSPAAWEWFCFLGPVIWVEMDSKMTYISCILRGVRGKWPAEF